MAKPPRLEPSGLKIELVHQIPGRVRLRVPALRSHPKLADRIVAAGMAHPGVRSVRVNLACVSVVVEGDRSLTNETSSGSLVKRWLATPTDSTAQAPSLAKASTTTSTFRRLAPLGFSLGGIALSFASGGLAPGFALVSTVAGALPIVFRGARALIVERRLTVDHLDAAAVGLMASLGDVRGAALMCGLVHLGEEIRDRTARRSQRAALDLQTALGQSAWLVHGQEKVRVSVDRLQVDDVVVAYPGDLIPVDGVVIDGTALVDQKMLTGESVPVLRSEGDRVFAGTVVADGKLYVRAEAVGSATRAGWIAHLLEEAPALDSRAASYAHRFADRLVAPTFGLAVVSFALTGNVARSAAILIVDFATGIRVSAPTSIMATLARAARHGVLIKSGRAIEQLAAVDVIIFDKTGTLTRGEPEVSNVVSLNPHFSPDAVLAFAAAAEMRLRHPTAAAVVRYAEYRGVSIPQREELQYTPGMGLVARVEGQEIRIGSARFMAGIGLDVGRLNGTVSRLKENGSSLVYVAINGALAGIVTYHDPVRDESSAVVQHLRGQGIRETLIVTGDDLSTAQAVAQSLGVERVHAGVLPDEKAAVVRALQQAGHVVAVVGDGINDSPALAVADVSISLSHAADVARETADVLLVDSDLWGLVQAIDLARQCVGLIRQNLVVVGVPNAAALALATVGGLSPVGSTILNNGSTIIAALNSLRPLVVVNGQHNGHHNGQNGHLNGAIDRAIKETS
jgi:Cu2+-exporting ATPase